MSTINKLLELIDIYLAVGKSILTRFFNEQKIKAPKSNLFWSANTIKQKGYLKDGTAYFKHGHGIDFKGKKWNISMDFGERGEWDGFDAWKLFSFAKDKNFNSYFANEDEIGTLLIKGVKHNIFVKRGDLYYKK